MSQNISKTTRRKENQDASAIGASSSSSLLDGWWNLRHSQRSIWFCTTRRLIEWTSCCMAEMVCCMDDMESCMELMLPWIEANASIIWEEDATSDMPTGIGGGGGTSSSWSSLRSYALDFIRVCLLIGSWIFIFGSPTIPMPNWRIICVSRQPNGRLVWPSS
jgi:hypothetical protein